VKEEDPQEYGDIYSLTAIKSDTRLLLHHHEGKRSTIDAIELFNAIERMRSKLSITPVYVSDDWDAFEKALLNVHGEFEFPQYKGIGRKPLPIRAPNEDLKYVKVFTKKIGNKAIGKVKRVIFGTKKKVLETLGIDSKIRIGTSYVERMNLTIRNSLARFIRKGMNFSKSQEMHTSTFNFFQAWYNFIKIHSSLKLKVNCGNKKWEQRTPAMAEGLTNHIWSLRELLSFRLPVQ